MERFKAGLYYDYDDGDLLALEDAAETWLGTYNVSQYIPQAERHAILTKNLGSFGAGSVIRPSFHCDYGFNIYVGAHCFINFNCVFLDCGRIEIGDGTLLGPAVQIYAADHPRDASERCGWVRGLPVRIGSRCWIGGGALIMPGVTIGDEAVVGAGAVVTKNVSPGETVAGNPARVVVKQEESKQE